MPQKIYKGFINPPEGIKGPSGFLMFSEKVPGFHNNSWEVKKWNEKSSVSSFYYNKSSLWELQHE